MKRSQLRTRPRRPDVTLKPLQAEWAAVIGPCAVCLDEGTPVRADDRHHVIPEQRLKSDGYPPDVVWDVRNRMLLCRRHHEWHHSRYRPVPLSLIPEAAHEFADELGLAWLLLVLYPAGES